MQVSALPLNLVNKVYLPRPWALLNLKNMAAFGRLISGQETEDNEVKQVHAVDTAIGIWPIWMNMHALRQS